MENSNSYKNFLEWCKREGKYVKQKQEVHIIDGDLIKTEIRDAMVLNINPIVIKEYEDKTGNKFNDDEFIILNK